MSKQLFFTGFEGGARDNLATFSSIYYMDDGTARTGEFYLAARLPAAAANNGFARASTPTAGQAIADGHYATGNTRVYFRLPAYPSGNDVFLAGYAFGGGANNFDGILINSTGHFCAGASNTTIGTYSTTVLALNTLYRVNITTVRTNPTAAGVNHTIAVTVSVYQEDGTLVETVTANGTFASASALNILPPNLGHCGFTNSTFFADWDDWVSVIEDDGPATLPVSTRVTRVDPTGQSIAQWTGDWRTVVDIPRSTTTDEQSSNTLGYKSTFVHKTASELSLSGIEAIQLYAQMKTAVAGDEDLLINSTITVVAVGVAYPAAVALMAQSWQNYTNVEFDSFTFGVQNRRSIAVQLGQIYCEILHNGSDYFKPLLVGTGSWKQKIITYVSNGLYREITGIGFRPQVVIIKKLNGAASAGAMKLGCSGGTQSKPFGAVTESLAITYLTNDGFKLGLSPIVNEDGFTYVAICIQDGGFGTDCKFLRFGEYIGNAIDNTNIVIKNGWQPTFVLIAGTGTAYYRTNLEVGDSSINLGASAGVTDLIQALNANGFQVGSGAGGVNSTQIYPYFAIKDSALLAPLFDYGTLVATGAAEVVSGLGFLPDFVAAKRIAAIDAQWRQTDVQAAPDSTLWSSVTANATGITALNADGFNLGATLVQAGQTTKWFAFKKSGDVNVVPVISVNAGVDQVINAFSTANLVGTGSSTYPCAAMTYAWSKVSGPGSVVFSAPAALVTNADFNATGVYVLRLTVSDGLNSATDDIQITVVNAAPTANAGPDLQGLSSSTFNLNGATADDGLPIPPGVLTSTWSKVSGPGLVAFANPNNPITTCTVTSSGNYVLRLTAYDGEKTVYDEMNLAALEGCKLPSANPVLPCGT